MEKVRVGDRPGHADTYPPTLGACLFGLIRRPESSDMNLYRTLGLIFNVRKGEALPLNLLLIHSFLLGLTIVFYDTGASALFLTVFDA